MLDVPPPSLRLTPLLHEEGLTSFVDRFNIVNKLTIKLLKTNSEEIDMDDFWQDFSDKRSAIGSETAKAEFSSPSHGMDKETVKREACMAGIHANSEIRISGFDSEGDSLRGDNNDFSLKSEIRDLPRGIEAAAIQMFNRFDHLIRSGHISLPLVAPSVAAKLKALISTRQ